jgi:hypothetical protein
MSLRHQKNEKFHKIVVSGIKKVKKYNLQQLFAFTKKLFIAKLHVRSDLSSNLPEQKIIDVLSLSYVMQLRYIT